MKILVFYTPRSKSTAIHDALAKHYGLQPLCDMVTQSRIKNQNFDEYPSLIEQINNTDNICVKLNGNDFIDLKNNQVLDIYKTIDFASFDKIVFVTRDNQVDAVASYAYMNPADKSTWHCPRGESRVGAPYLISVQKVFYLLRGYVVFDIIRNYIMSQVPADKVCELEYETVETSIKDIFGIDMSTVGIDIVPNLYNYIDMASNYQEISTVVHEVYDIMKTYDLKKILDKGSYFWNSNL